MAQPVTKRSPLIFAIAFWMAINVFLMITLIANGDWQDLNNWIEIALWAISIPALLSMKKWGTCLRNIHLNLHLKHKHGHLNLLPSLDKRPPSNYQYSNHNLSV